MVLMGDDRMTWYKKYFTEEWMRFRDAIALLKKASSEVTFLEKVLEISPPAKVLDVGCGFGRHAIELALRGYEVTGVDISAELLACARKLAQQKAVRVSWVQQDMRNIDFSEEFDAALCLFTSFGYFETEEENRDTLRRVSEALRPRSRFILDIENRDGLLMRYQSRDWWQTELGDLVMEERRFDPVKGRGHTKILLVREDRKVEHNLSIRWYSIPELTRILEDAGMHMQSLYGGLDGSAYGLEAMRLVAVAEKT
jgi:SAM-dependent methyltransferase